MVRVVIGILAVCVIVFVLHGCWVPTYLGNGAIAGRLVSPMTFLNIHSSSPRWLVTRWHYFGDVHSWNAPYFATIPNSRSIVVSTGEGEHGRLHIIDARGGVRSVPSSGFGANFGDSAPEFADEVLGLGENQFQIHGRMGAYTIDLKTGEWTRFYLTK